MRLTPKEVRVLELAMDVCEKMKNSGSSDQRERAACCYDDCEALIGFAGVDSEPLDDEPE